MIIVLVVINKSIVPKSECHGSNVKIFKINMGRVVYSFTFLYIV